MSKSTFKKPKPIALPAAKQKGPRPVIHLTPAEKEFLGPLLHQKQLLEAQLNVAAGLILKQHGATGSYSLEENGPDAPCFAPGPDTPAAAAPSTASPPSPPPPGPEPWAKPRPDGGN